MKRSPWRAALAWLLCLALLLSGALLILHVGHACHDQACMLCPILENCRMALQGALALSAVAVWGIITGRSGACSPVGNWFDPEGTPVQRKVKLLN